MGYRGPPSRGGAGRPRRDPPPPAPQAAGAPGPNPPSPRPREELERGPPPRPSRRLPQEPRRTSDPAPTRQDAAQIAPREGGRARTGVVWGATPPIGQNDASDTRFVACPGKAEGRNGAERPPALQAPPGRANGGHGAPPPPPSLPLGTRTPRTRPAARSPHRACRPRGQSRAHTAARPRPQHVDSGPQQPAQWAGSRGRGSA